MTVFGNYARYYDLLYKTKDYVSEARFVHQLLQKHAPADSSSILELGCGTGAHAALLAKQGYHVHGVDLSREMLHRFEDRRAQLPVELNSKLASSHGDVRDVRLGKRFDVVLSLFHVMSYQSTNQDFAAAFATAKTHLRPGGVFIFDVWYGPAVLTDRPTERTKRLEDEFIEVTRTAKPVMHPNENLVDVNYELAIRDKTTGVSEELRETHRMRYLFKSEIELFSRSSDMRLVECGEWLTGRPAGFDTWGAYFVVADGAAVGQS